MTGVEISKGVVVYMIEITTTTEICNLNLDWVMADPSSLINILVCDVRRQLIDHYLKSIVA